jgi:hypothetical protein
MSKTCGHPDGFDIPVAGGAKICGHCAEPAEPAPAERLCEACGVKAGAHTLCNRCYAEYEKDVHRREYGDWLEAERKRWTDGLAALAGIARGETWENSDYSGLKYHLFDGNVRVRGSHGIVGASVFINEWRWRRVSEKHEHVWVYRDENPHERHCRDCGRVEVASWSEKSSAT